MKYTDYKRFGAKSKITYEGQEITKDTPKAGTQPPAASQPAATRSEPTAAETVADAAIDRETCHEALDHERSFNFGKISWGFGLTLLAYLASDREILAAGPNRAMG